MENWKTIRVSSIQMLFGCLDFFKRDMPRSKIIKKLVVLFWFLNMTIIIM